MIDYSSLNKLMAKIGVLEKGKHSGSIVDDLWNILSFK
jgi:hypothetical protein